MKLKFALLIATASRLMLATDTEFGATGLASFETMQLSAFCADETPTAVVPCTLTFAYHRTDGSSVKESTVTLAAGTGAFLDLRGTEAVGRANTVEIVPCVKVLRGGAFTSLQVFDNLTGRTNLRVSWSDRPQFRSGEAEFAPSGITLLDTARLAVVCSDEPDLRAGGIASPCEVELEFHNLQGRLVKQARLSLKPGTGGLLDLRTSELGTSGLGTSGRLEIVPCIKVISGQAVGTSRILDTFTGRTNSTAFPAALALGQQPEL